MRGFGAIALTLLLVACEPAATSGPGEIAWDRDECHHCSMTIGDRRFAAQVRFAGRRQVFSFDDLGCALVWLDTAFPGHEPEPAHEFWVRNASGDDWIDADQAFFAEGFETPMRYGFGATVDAGLRLAEVRERVRERERERRSAPR
jgi:nitrous oxide reductase accessory protein NosL